MGSPREAPPLECAASDASIRKRVCKACDHCRLKKSKCDGSRPCRRCKAGNKICAFGKRKRSNDRVFPKGYIELLEQQQIQLNTGIRKLYKSTLNREGWVGEPLAEAESGSPLTHDILQRLGALDKDSSEIFQEGENMTQQRLITEESTNSLDSRQSCHSNIPPSERLLLKNASTIDDNLFPTIPQNKNSPHNTHWDLSPCGMPYLMPVTAGSSVPSAEILQKQNWPWLMEGLLDNTSLFNKSLMEFDSIPSRAVPETMTTMGDVDPRFVPVTAWDDRDLFETLFNPTLA